METMEAIRRINSTKVLLFLFPMNHCISLNKPIRIDRINKFLIAKEILSSAKSKVYM